MFNTGADSVSNIHRRWSLTRLNPSSYKISYIMSLLSATILIIIFHIYYAKIDQINLAISLPLGITALTSANFLDFFALHGTPINKISKVLHVSAFANLLWVSTVSLGIASDALFSKTGSSVNYVIEGMLLVVGLRIGILTSVFGASLRTSLNSNASPASPAVAPPAVIMITIDTLRADHLACYGYRRIETPSIDALAGEGIRFEHAYAQVPLTLPSHAVILTGAYPVSNSVRA